MPALKLSDFKKGNWWVTFFVLAVVLILFFIPDIIGFDTSLPRVDGKFSLEIPKVATGNEEDTDVENIRYTEEKPEEIASDLDQLLDGQNPLDQVAYLIDQGYIDHLADVKGGRKIEGMEEDASALETIFGKDEEEETDEKQRAEFLPRGQVNWTQLKSKRSKRILRNVQSRAQALAREMGDENSKTKFAILNLTSGIDKILGDADRSMSAKDAVYYLEHLDLDVTRTFAEQKVPRALFLKWSKISLAAILGGRRSDRLKEMTLPPFDPRLRLIQVQLKKLADRRGNPSQRNNFFVGFRAVLRGAEVKKVDLYRDGLMLKTLPLKKDPRKKNHYEVIFRQGVADGRYSFYVYDKDGEMYIRHYNFRGSNRAFRWQYNPAGNVYVSLMPSRGPGDPRIDTVFRYRSKSSADPFFSNGKQGRSFSVF